MHFLRVDGWREVGKSLPIGFCSVVGLRSQADMLGALYFGFRPLVGFFLLDGGGLMGSYPLAVAFLF